MGRCHIFLIGSGDGGMRTWVRLVYHSDPISDGNYDKNVKKIASVTRLESVLEAKSRQSESKLKVHK